MEVRLMLLSLLVCLLLGCNVIKKIDFDLSKMHLIEPPGTIRINDTLCIDKEVLSNVGYLEYQYHLLKLNGSHSDVYRACLLDTVIWSSLDSCLSDLSSDYHKERAFWRYPVVGITHEQAKAYTRWRTNKVLENQLFRAGVIDLKTATSEDENFTAEKYFSGRFLDYKPDERVKYYYEYRLPSMEEVNLFFKIENDWQKSESSLDLVLLGCDDSFLTIGGSDHMQVKDQLNIAEHLSEWSDRPGYVFENHLAGSKSEDEHITDSPMQANVLIGFRNVAILRKVE